MRTQVLSIWLTEFLKSKTSHSCANSVDPSLAASLTKHGFFALTMIACFQYGFFTNQTIHFAILPPLAFLLGGNAPVSFLLGGFWLGVAINIYFVQFLVSEKFPRSEEALKDINLGWDSLQPFPQSKLSDGSWKKLDMGSIFLSKNFGMFCIYDMIGNLTIHQATMSVERSSLLTMQWYASMVVSLSFATTIFRTLLNLNHSLIVHWNTCTHVQGRK